jgi:hypothetical protein
MSYNNLREKAIQLHRQHMGKIEVVCCLKTLQESMPIRFVLTQKTSMKLSQL